MSTEENKASIHRFVEPWNNGNFAAFDEVCAPTYHLIGGGGVAELKAVIANFRESFPDLHCTVEEMIAEGDKVAYRWTMRGTHQGVYEGIAQTGKAITLTGITILRFADGKIVEDRFESGSPDIKHQLA